MRRLWGRTRGITPTERAAEQTPDDAISEADLRIIERALPLTMTGEHRLLALIDAVRHCERHAIPGDFVECGVWRGGSVLAMALTLLDEGSANRDLHLFDTFEGMTEPTDRDVSATGESARLEWEAAQRQSGRLWDEVFGAHVFGEDQVRKMLGDSGYPPERTHLVAGRVEETVPRLAPEKIALLRLDTDWYESTRHELVHLYPRLVVGGLLIIDDYGHWKGARSAVDEYFAEHPPAPYLHRIDYTGRIAVKPPSA